MFCYIGKVTFVGDSRSGKTSLIKRYQDNEFNSDPTTTIGVDFTIKEVPPTKTNPNHHKLQIWDTAGQERFTNIITHYFRNSYTIVIVFDLTNRDSFNHIKSWIKTVRAEYEPEHYIVVGNKSDLIKQRKISELEVHEYLAEVSIEYTYIETSAKTNQNVDKIFNTIISKLDETTKQEPSKQKSSKLKNPLSLRKIHFQNGSKQPKSAFTILPTLPTLPTLSYISPFSSREPSLIIAGTSPTRRGNCCTIS